MEISYIFALTTGILGGFGHCIGMCGPLVATYTLQYSTFNIQHSTLRKILPHLLYNTGRMTTYVSIGGLMGLAGSFVNVAGSLAGIQNAVAIFTGLLMIFLGLRITGIIGIIGGDMDFIERHNSLILKAVKGVLQAESNIRYYLLGILLGFLPCGLSYTVFIAAAGTGDVFSGITMAFFFGIGTVPSLLLFGMTVSYISSRVRGWVYRMGGIIVIIMGLYFLIRGIGMYAEM